MISIDTDKKETSVVVFFICGTLCLWRCQLLFHDTSRLKLVNLASKTHFAFDIVKPYSCSLEISPLPFLVNVSDDPLPFLPFVNL